MTEPHGWPLEQPAEGTLRPWYLTATGFLMVLVSHPEEARRARSGLLEHGVSEEDIRLYESEEILRILARAQKERSILAKAVFDLAADPFPALVPTITRADARSNGTLTPRAFRGRHPARLTGVVSARSQRQHSLRG